MKPTSTSPLAHGLARLARRAALAGLLSLVGLAALLGPDSAAAQGAYPTKPVKLVVPYPPGGFTDIITRQVAAKLGGLLGQPMVVENRPGAGTNIGAEAVARAPADGYTLFMGTSSLAINRTLYAKLGYDAEKDLTAAGIFATTGFVLMANPSLPATNAAELVAYAKSRGEPLTFGSSGNGAVNHLAGVLFASMSGIRLQHVPYKGSSQAITDMIGGQVNLVWGSTLESIPVTKAGKARALGITEARRNPAAPEIAPLGDTVKGYEVLFWMGLFAPAGTPPEIVARLTQDLRTISADPEIRQGFESRGANAVYLSPAQSAETLRRDIQRWGLAVRDAGARVD